MASIVPVGAQARRRFGTDRKVFEDSDDFDAPLQKDVLDSFAAQAGSAPEMRSAVNEALGAVVRLPRMDFAGDLCPTRDQRTKSSPDARTVISLIETPQGWSIT